MPLVTITNLEKSFGDRVLFSGLNMVLDRGERVGFIGDNGAGKSTIFRILTGEDKAERGDVSVNRGTRIGHLMQDAVFDPKNTVIDEAELAFSELHALSHKLRDLEHAMGEHTDEELEKTLAKYSDVQHEFEEAGGYAWQHKLEATLLGVGLDRAMWEQNVETLSGGQRSKLNLAKILIAEPDMLLLDEPTNHLDLESIEWLEDYLLKFDGAVLIISHDRYLLDRLSTRIIWLAEKKLRSYPGNYAAFVKQRDVEVLTQQRAYDQQQAYIAKQAEFVRRFSAGQRAREAQGRAKHLNRLLTSDAMVSAVAKSQKISLGIDTDQRAGDRVLTVHELAKSFDQKKLWEDVKFDVKRGDRLGIIGPNGTGKSTLLKVLTGEESADGGSIRWGSNLAIGYYDQRLDEFDPDRTILEEVSFDRDRPEKVFRDALGRMRFTGDDVDKPMGLLSGGEKARVALTELLLDGPNVLLLDEPTNHLDVNSCEALEGALSDFAGTILCVSHDRYFLEKVVKRLLIVHPPEVIDFDGAYHDWQKKVKDGTAFAKPAKTSAKPGASTAAKKSATPAKPKPVEKSSPAATKDNPYKRKFGRLSPAELEKEIARAEADIRDINARFGETSVARDANKAKRLQAEHDELTAKLAELEAEYYQRSA